MNKIMQNMMKPIPVNSDTSASLRLAQEQYVLNWLKNTDYSVRSIDVYRECRNIPGLEYDEWNNYNRHTRKGCTKILQRLERKGHIVSVLYGSCRYYSIPVDNGGDN